MKLPKLPTLTIIWTMILICYKIQAVQGKFIPLYEDNTELRI